MTLFGCGIKPTPELIGFFSLAEATSSIPIIQYTVGGTVTGLTGTVVLQNNLSNDLSISTDGAFTFTSGVNAGSAYSVTVLTQPSLQTCSVSNGSGTIGSADVTNITINCTTNSTVNTLSALSTSSGTLNPTFATSTLSYTFSVVNSVANITVTPTATDTTATIQVNSTNVISGVASGNIPLSVGSNTITIIVTAQDSSTSTYTLTIIRSTLNFLRIFVTANTYDGNLRESAANGKTGADLKCNAVDANKPSDGSVYKAIIAESGNRIACSTVICISPTNKIDWVLRANTQYVNTGGTTIFTTNSDGIFVFGSLSASFLAASQYWTGISTVNLWVASGGNHCSNWTSNSGGVNGNYGNGSSTTYTSIAATSGACNTTKSLLCAEQ